MLFVPVCSFGFVLFVLKVSGSFCVSGMPLGQAMWFSTHSFLELSDDHLCGVYLDMLEWAFSLVFS